MMHLEVDEAAFSTKKKNKKETSTFPAAAFIRTPCHINVSHSIIYTIDMFHHEEEEAPGTSLLQ
jgi:hypothetical protein